ncbi:MAG: hypothetical protein DWQ04_15975 [Chloroflexi bacterium]|nr:MAG: hypothetical protein DWQ04_15975 [Chloroflexota bacterium]
MRTSKTNVLATLESDSPIPLSEAATLAIENEYGIRDVSTDSINWMEGAVKSLIRFKGDIDIKSLTPRDVHEWQQHEKDRDLSPLTVNSYLRGVKTVYSRLVRKGIVDFNPAEPVKYLPKPPSNPKACSKETYRAMINAAESARDKAILGLLWCTGCRVGGIVSMKLDKIEFWEKDGKECCAIYIVEKFSKSRNIYACGEELEYLQQWLQERPNILGQKALFLTSIRPFRKLTRVGVQKVLRRLAKKAGVTEKFNPHSFRHAFAIRKLEEKNDLPAVSAWLGHSNPSFTASIYTTRTESQLRDLYFKDSDE